MSKPKRLIPTGTCWCGCEADVQIGKFFLPGHDKFAESAVIQLHYDSVANFIVEHGYGPSQKNLRQTLGKAGNRGSRSR